jgi:hypothetical protein
MALPGGIDEAIEHEMETVIRVIKAFRALRERHGIPKSVRLPRGYISIGQPNPIRERKGIV